MKSLSIILLLIFSLFLNFNVIEENYVKIIEYYDEDAIKVKLNRVIDGDTIEVILNNEIKKVRIVGYDAFEISESKGKEAKNYLESLCLNTETYLDIDDLETYDKYNRTLGYVWCKKGETYYSVTKAFLLLRPDLVKNALYIPPDEHPYKVWLTNHIIKLQSSLPIKVYIYNITGNYSYENVKNMEIKLKGGYYIVESNLYLNTNKLNLMKDIPESINLLVSNTQEFIISETVTTTITTSILKNFTTITYTTKTETIVVTVTKTLPKTNETTSISNTQRIQTSWEIFIIMALILIIASIIIFKLKKFL